MVERIQSRRGCSDIQRRTPPVRIEGGAIVADTIDDATYSSLPALSLSFSLSLSRHRQKKEGEARARRQDIVWRKKQRGVAIKRLR